MPSLAELYGITPPCLHADDADRGDIHGAGMFIYGTRAQVQPLTSLEMMLFATLATILGGIGRIWGAALAAILLGIVQNSSILVHSLGVAGVLALRGAVRDHHLLSSGYPTARTIRRLAR